ncbi:hypothetical protein HPB49_007332 [Dermacentor silvarum]|uniref:Uncharacterized protein n=1 Tax=Dermacentor silvarum TaxID=543639 RepID=A0ACB8CW41_DERSI|nr:hypothetical protein HPB49_007332 [Dermacentor silvarum]
MEVVEVEGTEITPEEITPKAGCLSTTTTSNDTPRRHHPYSYMAPSMQQESAHTENTQQSALRRSRAPQKPRLPKNDIKIVIRPRDGVNHKQGDAQIRDSILQITGIITEEAEEDIPLMRG